MGPYHVLFGGGDNSKRIINLAGTASVLENDFFYVSSYHDKRKLSFNESYYLTKPQLSGLAQDNSSKIELFY